MTVEDISRAGLRMRFHVEQDIRVGMKCVVQFNLDDAQHSLIRKESTVRGTDGLSAGVEFDKADSSDPTEKALGFYLFE